MTGTPPRNNAPQPLKEPPMFRKSLLPIALPALSVPSPALARDSPQGAPDLTGVWNSKDGDSVIRGSGTTHNPAMKAWPAPARS